MCGLLWKSTRDGWKTGHTSWTLHVLNILLSCRLESAELYFLIRINRFVREHELSCEKSTQTQLKLLLSFLKNTVSVVVVGGWGAGVRIQGWSEWWSTLMLICKVIAFRCRIANSNICHFVKHADSHGHQRHRLQGTLSPTMSICNNGCQV